MKILVTGATGNQGGAVAEHLLRGGHEVRAFVRARRSRRAQHLQALGAELAQGDYDHPTSLVEAAAGVQGMFALATPFEGGIEEEVAQGFALVDSARKAGVRHFIYSSVAGADRRTGIPHFESKHRVEEHLKKSGLDYTIVGPTFFRENFLGALEDLAKSGVLAMPLAADKPLQTLCRNDLGAFVAQLFAAPRLGQRIDVASDETTGPEMARSFARALGRPIRYLSQPSTSSEDDLGRMWEWINRVGYHADLARLERDFPEVPWSRFERWAIDLIGEPQQPVAP